MTPQPKAAWKRLREQRAIPWPLVIIGSLIPIAAALASVARSVNTTVNSFATRTAVESMYVRRDSNELRHQRDSLNTSAALTAIQKDVNALFRACQRRGEC